MVRSRLSLILCVAAAALFMVACSSTTVVARDDRLATSDSAAAAATDDEIPNTLDSDAAEDTDAAEDAEEPSDTADITDTDTDTDTDRGDRDDADLRTPRELVEAAGFGLGGSEQLDGLFVDCEGGMDLACDILLLLSAFESVEETAALTCGGRSQSEIGFCTSGIEAQPDELVFKTTSEGLADIVTACEVDGDMTACDFLYYRSPLGSDFQEIGGTCGGRVGVAVPDCRTVLAE